MVQKGRVEAASDDYPRALTSSVLANRQFVDKWNSFSLSSKYYKGIAPSAAPHVRTTHSWSFKNVSNDDIQRARNEVTKTTEGLDGFGNAPQPGPSEPRRRVMGPAMPGPGPAVGPSFPEDSDEEAKRIAAARQARRADRKDRDEDMEELMPRETGRDRMIEKRKMENAKRREFDSKDYDMEFGEKDLLGGGDDFKARWGSSERDEQGCATVVELTSLTLPQARSSRRLQCPPRTIQSLRDPKESRSQRGSVLGNEGKRPGDDGNVEEAGRGTVRRRRWCTLRIALITIKSLSVARILTIDDFDFAISTSERWT